jgi:AmmeMemoRadiSam system protein A
MLDLNDNHRKTLLSIARQSIAAVLDGRAPNWSADDLDEVLHHPAGAFVTLRTFDGELRGCIGSIRAVEPLYRAVATSAISAAFRDPRFEPLRPGELEAVQLEISVMGPIEAVSNFDDIGVGRDGLIVSRGRYAGLLLPQVANNFRTCNRLHLIQQAAPCRSEA